MKSKILFKRTLVEFDKDTHNNLSMSSLCQNKQKELNKMTYIKKLCTFFTANTGQVQSSDVQAQYGNTHTGIRQKQIGSEHAHMQSPSLPGSFDPAYPHTSNHVLKYF